MFGLLLTRRFPIAAIMFALTFSIGGMATADDEKKEAKAEVKKEDRYAIPEGDSAVLLKFVEALQNFRPETAEQFFEHRKKAPAAMKAAAEKILKLEKDPTSAAAQKAKVLLLSAKVAGLADAKADEQKATVAEINAVLKTTKLLSRNELGIAFGAASALEQAGNEKLAIEAYNSFGELFSKQTDDLMVSYGAKMLGAARRIDLPGNEIKLEGKLVDGGEFNWKDYRGKVVLVDFWATWCGPCIQELPNVKKNYALYHDKGFDVVGISLDSERGRLEEFLNKHELPWKTLFQDGGGWDHPIASYYGIMGIPTVILVDKEGKVVSLNARGPELGRHLKELLGPADAE
jgi:thiol-disulfide isomerase/thioredoxin